MQKNQQTYKHKTKTKQKNRKKKTKQKNKIDTLFFLFTIRKYRYLSHLPSGYKKEFTLLIKNSHKHDLMSVDSIRFCCS